MRWRSLRTTSAGLKSPDLQQVAEVEAAARAYGEGRRLVNAGTRAKREAGKVLAEVPDGVYGAVTLSRVPSSREVVDVEAARALLAQYGLELPMRRCAPSLKFSWRDGSP